MIASRHSLSVSPKRIVGAAFFGLCLGGYCMNAAAYVIPNILEMVEGATTEVAQASYESSFRLHCLELVGVAFLGACVAGFLAKRWGIFVGLLSNSVWILLDLWPLSGGITEPPGISKPLARA